MAPRSHFFAALGLCAVLSLDTAARAATLTVGASGQNYTTIAAAISAASNGDVIRVMDAVHTEAGIIVNKDVTIEGVSAAATVVQAHASRGAAGNRVFQISGTPAAIRNMTIRHGNSGGYGGAIYVQSSGSLSLSGCTVTANDISGYGGAVGALGQVTIDNCTLHDNSAIYAGGLYLNVAATVSRSTLSSNFASAGGGGVFANATGTPVVSLVNTTISGNMANLDGGGVLANQGSGQTLTLSMTNVTIADNRCDYDGNSTGSGGGLAIWTSTPTVSNSIIANNYKGPTGSTLNDLNGTFHSGDYNLFRSTSGATINGTTTHNITGQDPLIAALAANGGPTLTHALQDGSPARDVIPNGANGMGTTPLDADQRGEFRPAEGAGDIGAFEWQPPAPQSVTSPAPGSEEPVIAAGPDQPSTEANQESTPTTTTGIATGCACGVFCLNSLSIVVMGLVTLKRRTRSRIAAISRFNRRAP